MSDKNGSKIIGACIAEEKRKNFIGKLMKEKRIEKNITQAKLASLTGLHRAYISDIEVGRYMPNISSIAKINKVLQFDLNLIMEAFN